MNSLRFIGPVAVVALSTVAVFATGCSVGPASVDEGASSEKGATSSPSAGSTSQSASNDRAPSARRATPSASLSSAIPSRAANRARVAGRVPSKPLAGGVCPADFPGDAPYNFANAPTLDCTQPDLDFIKAEASKPGETFQDLEAALTIQNAACASCVFTHDTDPTWGPIVYVGGAGAAFFNFGSCFEDAAGGSPACGQAVEEAELCLDTVCDAAACGTAAARQLCINNVLADPTSCGMYDINGSCGPGLPAVSNACNTGLQVISVVCGPG